MTSAAVIHGFAGSPPPRNRGKWIDPGAVPSADRAVAEREPPRRRSEKDRLGSLISHARPSLALPISLLTVAVRESSSLAPLVPSVGCAPLPTSEGPTPVGCEIFAFLNHLAPAGVARLSGASSSGVLRLSQTAARNHVPRSVSGSGSPARTHQNAGGCRLWSLDLRIWGTASCQHWRRGRVSLPPQSLTIRTVPLASTQVSGSMHSAAGA